MRELGDSISAEEMSEEGSVGGSQVPASLAKCAAKISLHSFEILLMMACAPFDPTRAPLCTPITAVRELTEALRASFCNWVICSVGSGSHFVLSSIWSRAARVEWRELVAAVRGMWERVGSMRERGLRRGLSYALPQDGFGVAAREAMTALFGTTPNLMSPFPAWTK